MLVKRISDIKINKVLFYTEDDISLHYRNIYMVLKLNDIKRHKWELNFTYYDNISSSYKNLYRSLLARTRSKMSECSSVRISIYDASLTSGSIPSMYVEPWDGDPRTERIGFSNDNFQWSNTASLPEICDYYKKVRKWH